MQRGVRNEWSSRLACTPHQSSLADGATVAGNRTHSLACALLRTRSQPLMIEPSTHTWYRPVRIRCRGKEDGIEILQKKRKPLFGKQKPEEHALRTILRTVRNCTNWPSRGGTQNPKNRTKLHKARRACAPYKYLGFLV